MLEASVTALLNIFTPLHFGLLVAGVLAGLIIGIIPGLGGVVGLTLLLPFVLRLSPEGTIILLIGLAGVIATSDTLPAVLIGVPGSVGAQATVVDGFAMAKKGEAGRALGAAYVSSMIGGVFGALCLMLTIPVLRPLVLSMGSPEFFMVALLGVALIGGLAGRSPLIGIVLGIFGVMISMVGMDPQTGYMRWTFGQMYLLDGFPFIPAVLGLFAIPELLELIGRRQNIAGSRGENLGLRGQVLDGVKEALRHWALILRCSPLGTFVGFVPGLGASVVDWLAYGFAKQTCRNSETFGQGDIRGVIAPESANNAKEGGSLIPTIAFGVPGSASMVILLGALLMLGVQPGPQMVTEQLALTMTMVWTLALANILGGLICLLFSSQFAKLCYVRIGLLAPVIVVALAVAALQATTHVGDLLVLLVFGAIGWLFKKIDWPRPPLVLGLILGPVVRKYYFISTEIYGLGWLTHPGVLIIGILLIASVLFSVLAMQRARREVTT